MNNRWLVIGAVLVFSIGLAIIVGLQLTGVQAMLVGLGVGIGVMTGILSGIGTAALLLRGRIFTDNDVPSGMTQIVMPHDQAQKLIKMLNTRQQADPDAFPLTAERDRQFTTVGGAAWDEETDEDS